MDGSLGKQRAERPEMSPADIKYTPAKELLSTAQPNRLLQRNLEMDYDEPPSLGLEVPESYLAAMRALQQQLERCQSELVTSRVTSEKLAEENASLKNQLMGSEKQKLESQLRTNQILRDYNSLTEVLNQTRLESMVLKKEVEQLKRQKQNVLEKVTQKVCKQRAINVLEEQQSNRRADSLRKENVNFNELSSSKFRTPYLKQAISTEITAPRVSELPLVTLHPNEFAGIQPPPPSSSHRKESTSNLHRHQNPSISSLYEHRYEQIATQRTSEASSIINSNYVQLVKQIMRNEKLLVEMNHQLECYQKQLIDSDRSRSRSSKEQMLLKIDILRKDINIVKGDIAEGRRKQSLM